MPASNENNVVQIIAGGNVVCFDWHHDAGTWFDDRDARDIPFLMEGI